MYAVLFSKIKTQSGTLTETAVDGRVVRFSYSPDHTEDPPVFRARRVALFTVQSSEQTRGDANRG